MKKILATLTVIMAAALGAQGQTTNYFYYQGTNSFSGLTLAPGTFSLPDGELYDQARLLFRSTNVTYGGGNIRISGITLSGQGITGSLTNFGDVILTANNTSYNSAYIPLTTDLASWTTDSSSISFTVEFRNGAIAPTNGAQFAYRVTYANVDGSQLNTSFGNVGLVAVPEPSTYFAAAGLLGLCLWSARRRLFKFSGVRSTSSGDSANGAV